MEAWVEVGTKILVDSGRRLMEVMERLSQQFSNLLSIVSERAKRPA
jgi:hypothetical protein